VKAVINLRGTRRQTLRRATLAAAVCGIGLSAIASAQQTQQVVAGPNVVARATALRASDRLGARLERTRMVPITVALKLRNPEQLDAFLAAGVTRPLTSEEMAATYLPTEDQAQAVVAYLRSAGYRNIVVAPNRMLVTAEGSAAVAESTFRTTMAHVATVDGRDAIANTTDVTIPEELQATVLSVIGLQTVHEAHTFARVVSPDALTPQAVTGHNPVEFASIYSAAGQTTGAGVPVGIITQGRITQTITDLNTFTANNGLPTVTTTTVNTNGTSTDTSGVIEWNLDSQDVVGAAGGQVGRIIFYNIPTLSTSNLTADINTVVSRNETKIINVSLGLCETSANSDGSLAAEDQLFAMAQAQGQTFSISTGDDGADECGNGGTVASWPASSAHVMAISGTRLDASTTTWNSEVVWNDLAAGGGATGGSLSTIIAKPAFQNGFVSGTKRGVADVSFTGAPASGARIVLNGGTSQVGGTSLSAPLFAGFWARAIAVKGAGVGFAAPLIYALPAGDFHDVTSGNNGGSTAGAGYDLATGRGSIIVSSMLRDLGGAPANVAPVANFTVATNGLTATFTDASTDSDGSIVSRSWNFGDGGTSTATSPSHTYASAGTFTVTLTVTDNGGLTGSKATSVTVTNPGQTFFQNTTPVTIPDLTTITSTINVSGISGAAPATLRVGVNITHTFRGDLVVTLIAPNNQTFTLSNRSGGSADNIVQTFTVNASGVTNPNGVWTLRVQDAARLDTGRLNNWSLQF
jgi:subtilase family serine protease